MQSGTVQPQREHLMPAALLRLASDQRLVEQVRAGSERAFEALFDRHHRPVLAFCRHMLGSQEEAEDVVQLTFLAAYRDLAGTEPPAALRPWLYAIARHRCLSALRARRERPVAEVTLPAADRLAAEVTTREDLRAILADVAHLPDDQRAALVLAELGDVSHEEIARILVCPREKVKALVFQARSSLLASRDARETPCADIREQLAALRGGALRRTTLRRHLRDCPSCRTFGEQVRVQRRALRLLLPVAPGVGLKRTILGAVFGSGTGGAGGAALSAVGLNWGGLAAALVVLAIPAGGITAAASPWGGRGDAPQVRRAVPGSTLPRPRAEPARSKRDRPGLAVLNRDVDQPRTRPVQTDGDANSAHEPQPVSSPGDSEPSRPQLAVASEPPTASGQAMPATAPKPDKWPANGQTAPATPAKPSKPPQANGRNTPAAPAKPSEPPQANGQRAPATLAKPGTPPQANRQPTPAAPSGPAQGPLPAAPGDAPGPAFTPQPSSPAAATPGGPRSTFAGAR
jgi:RNA polymerase sigma factor (sigma-70 family)